MKRIEKAGLRSIKSWVTLAVLGLAPLSAQPERQMDSLELAEGFEIEIWADGVVNARGMALSPSGVLYVGSRQKGLVHAVIDEGGKRRVIEIASELNMPSGVAFRDGSLYVGEVHRILRYDGIDERLDNPPVPVVVNGDLPDEEIKATIDKFTNIITGQGGTLVSVEEWGRRKLAYKIEGTLRGYYIIADFAGLPAAVKELERNYRIDDRVIRYLTMK